MEFWDKHLSHCFNKHAELDPDEYPKDFISLDHADTMTFSFLKEITESYAENNKEPVMRLVNAFQKLQLLKREFADLFKELGQENRANEELKMVVRSYNGETALVKAMSKCEGTELYIELQAIVGKFYKNQPEDTFWAFPSRR